MGAALLLAATLVSQVASVHSAQAGEVLDAVKKRGILNCGVNTGLAGFGIQDAQGVWRGLDVDTCRAVAAAILGDAEKIKFSPYNAQQRFTALQFGEIDVLARNTTLTLNRSASLGLGFAPVTYYDGAQFMVPTKKPIKSAKQLRGATICVQSGTTTEQVVAEFFRTNKMPFKTVIMEQLTEIENAFFSGRCDAYVTDGSGLAGTRAGRNLSDKDYAILPEMISKEPLALAYRSNDPQFGTIVDWTVYALIAAEEYGITQANVATMKATSTDPEVKRLLGADPGMGAALGIGDDWAFNAIKAVGNYGEVFERNIGTNSPLKLKRGLNALWSKGGLLYSPPIR
ncbi:MAG: amino acid ABC transporter substrate-binding protein [Candidatus Symbiobacter sp.]|nr:amino acid ABC transporter substrate-binding protein [Candidatus Symbiobacter sp.]